MGGPTLGGTKLVLVVDALWKMVFGAGFLTVDSPASAKLLPDAERWKVGCCRRPGARDMRDPEVERAW